MKAEDRPGNHPVSADRIWSDLMNLAGITEAGRPYTRRSFSPKFLEGRAWLQERFRAAGLFPHVDASGNLIGRLPGSDPDAGTIALGSHSDTVPDGGRFDGTAGVIVALEIARALRERGITLRHTLEVIDCLTEEVSEFGLSCVGSRGLTGALQPQSLDLRKPDGETLREAITRIGGDPDRITATPRDDLRAWLELHIEQGRVLGEGRTDVGIVTSAVGITRVEIELTGMADHAGTTPMHLRHDALLAAAEVVAEVRAAALRRIEAGDGYFVATTGELTVTPNAANVVPGHVRLLVEARSENRPAMERFLDDLLPRVRAIAEAQGITLSSCHRLSDAPPAPFDPGLVGRLEEAARKNGLSHVRMPSGAGHDAVFFSRITPTAMVFVPSRAGRSHCPEEWTEKEELALGALVLFDAVLGLDRGN